jgi:hypothetical protein
MSQEHDKSTTDAEVVEGIHPQASPFELGYQPETMPKIVVPDLPDDIQGMTAEALAQIPTLTEEAPGKELLEIPAQPLFVQAELTIADAVLAPIQDVPAQADTWSEVLHARIGKLTDDIHTLNIRLDRLEERIKAKV